MLYVDESRPPGRWWYIGVLLAVLDSRADALLAHLDRTRNAVDYHREIHHVAISTHQKAELACRWLDLALTADHPQVTFHVLGLDLHKMHLAAFGSDRRQQWANLYGRCLRMALNYAATSYLEGAVVRAIVHDARNLSDEEDFHRHTPRRMRWTGQAVATDSIELVDSDHEISGEHRHSSFIQLIDLILGATRDCLDLTTTKAHRLRVAHHWLPLVERLTDDAARRNSRSRHGYVGRCNVSFFPRDAIDQAEGARPSQFYVARRPALSRYNAPTLFDL